MHAGGNLQPGRTELVFGIEHFTLRSDLQRAAAQARLTISQPQRSIHHVQIVIEKGKAQIVAYAVATMLIHPQRGRLAQPPLQFTIEWRKAAIETDHQRQMTPGSQLDQRFRLAQFVRQRFIHTNMNPSIQQVIHYFIM